jgi:pantetheine-phosphate adenylyltransferase
MKRAVYAGSFDPLTRGHLWMIEELVVAVGTNPDKQYTFNVEERLRMLRESLDGKARERVTIDHFENRFLVHYAGEIGATHILRGIRSEHDYSYERGMRYINGDMEPDIGTVFLMPPREIAGLVGPDGWQEIVKPYLSEPVYQMMLGKFGDG